MIAAGITTATINDLFGEADDGGRSISDEEVRYRGVAGWMIFVGIAGLIFEVIMVLMHALISGQVMKSGIVTIGAVVSFYVYVILNFLSVATFLHSGSRFYV